MPRNSLYPLFVVVILGLISCQSGPRQLPILGERDFINGDTVYHTIPDFEFIDQDSSLVTKESFKGKIYIADFFFTHCPTICPKVTKQMMRLYDKYESNEGVLLLAHSIDVRNDTVGRLKEYADKLEIKAPKWRLVTGKKEDILGIANQYFSIAKEDSSSPGGFDHSGKLILVDKQFRVRSFCDGTDPNSVDQFMKDIDALLLEN